MVSLLTDRRDDLAISRAAPIRFDDRIARCVYYVARVDVRYYLVLIYDEGASGRDAGVTTMVTALHHALRATAVYDRLLKV